MPYDPPTEEPSTLTVSPGAPIEEPTQTSTVSKHHEGHDQKRGGCIALAILLGLLVIAGVALGLIFGLKPESKESATVVLRMKDVSVVIQLDQQPHETGWLLECEGGGRIEFPPGSYAGRHDDLVVQVEQIAYIDMCTFTIMDTAGNGIEDGFFQLYEGTDITDQSALIVEGSDFTDSTSVSFYLDQPSISPTVSPMTDEPKPTLQPFTPSNEPSQLTEPPPTLPPTNPTTQPHTPPPTSPPPPDTPPPTNPPPPDTPPPTNPSSPFPLLTSEIPSSPIPSSYAFSTTPEQFVVKSSYAPGAC